MKKLVLKVITICYLLIFASCGSLLEPPKSNNDYKNIVGNPVKIGNLEVAQYNFPQKLNWEDAKKACTKLGKGWTLPTKDELNILYQNRYKIIGFADYFYWSSSEYDHSYAWYQSFYDGDQDYYEKHTTYYVRPIRSF